MRPLDKCGRMRPVDKWLKEIQEAKKNADQAKQLLATSTLNSAEKLTMDRRVESIIDDIGYAERNGTEPPWGLVDICLFLLDHQPPVNMEESWPDKLGKSENRDKAKGLL